MILVSKLKCPGCGHSGAAEWKAYRPKFLRELMTIRGRFIPGGGGTRAFMCESCRCVAEMSEDLGSARA